MAQIIKRIIKDIKFNLSKEKTILSASLVGSLSDPNKKLEGFNDLDLVIICDKLNNSLFDNLNGLISHIKNRYSSGEIGITSSLKIGPIKIKSSKKKTIMIHFLVYSKSGYKKYESALTRFSFQHYKPLLGSSLSSFNNEKAIKVTDLFNNIDGIPAIRNWLTKKEIEYLEPNAQGIKILKDKLRGKLYIEVIFYSVLRLASNMLRLKKVYAETDLAMCKEFEESFSIELNKLPLEIYNLKQQLRKGRNFKKSEIEKIKLKALSFIAECENILRK